MDGWRGERAGEGRIGQIGRIGWMVGGERAGVCVVSFPLCKLFTFRSSLNHNSGARCNPFMAFKSLQMTRCMHGDLDGSLW